jgi:hypothetical protein
MAFALTTTTNFSGSIIDVFTVEPIVNTGSGGSGGEMAFTRGNSTRISSKPTEGTGSDVSYSITSNAANRSMSISVANPVPIGAAAIAAFAGNTQYGAQIHQNGNLIVAASKGGSSTSSSIPLGNFSVSVWIDNGTTPLPAGDYTVSVTTTLLAN